MRLVQAPNFAGWADPNDSETDERQLRQRFLSTGIFLIVGLLMLMGLLVSVPVLP
jgi:hypothetical protein